MFLIYQLTHSQIPCEFQLIDLVNSVFLITDPRNETVYERNKVSLEDIFNTTTQYTTLYEKKRPGAFTQFATRNGAHLLKAQISKKRMDSGRRIEQRIVYIMKTVDRVFLAQNISSYQARFARFIEGLRMDGFEVLGYARKSLHDLSSKALKKNLQNMLTYLRSRSLVGSVYVSPKSLAKRPTISRDMSNMDEELTQMELDSYAGNMQMCLVTVNYAALSTKPADVLALVKNHKSLEYIVVDRLKETGRYQVYRHIEILRTPDCLESFDCHKDGQEEDAKPSSFRPHHRLHLALVARNFYCSTAKVDLLLPICIKYSPTFEYGRFFGFDNCLNKVPI
ncbi:hypothetical protein G6F57_006080 [Rhizopus arrhizus]|uniref:Uncharacterized protein n=1 Tax=Rhizopus oryzae TaxID=64495 RepID=A0A9P6XA22_RHIOR|nr:hypothetical protein G6F30_001609 [Rhizopus arrhizus]KAG1416273.1 hypothetical protein G6F58_006061 [Rhizopus delemar]KAG0989660.1 hypothetical protein G6F29_000823 [Rhizopus arrhizus]KAG0993282.1 hypothetical protein G6F28_006846 [Rhizopus arrhizus]KAG1007193.1 hypothetical protein G6F27_007608 [Rhizopus arrhizus]